MPHSRHDIGTKVTEPELAAWRADSLHPHTPARSPARSPRYQERAFTKGTAVAGAGFNEVWVINHSIAHLVWSSGWAACGWSNAG